MASVEKIAFTLEATLSIVSDASSRCRYLTMLTTTDGEPSSVANPLSVVNIEIVGTK